MAIDLSLRNADSRSGDSYSAYSLADRFALLQCLSGEPDELAELQLPLAEYQDQLRRMTNDAMSPKVLAQLLTRAAKLVQDREFDTNHLFLALFPCSVNGVPFSAEEIAVAKHLQLLQLNPDGETTLSGERQHRLLPQAAIDAGMIRKKGEDITEILAAVEKAFEGLKSLVWENKQ